MIPKHLDIKYPKTELHAVKINQSIITRIFIFFEPYKAEK